MIQLIVVESYIIYSLVNQLESAYSPNNLERTYASLPLHA